METRTLHPVITAIRLERANQKLTQQQLADMAGISRRTLQEAESGSDTTLGTLDRLCTALGLTLDVTYDSLGPPTLDDLVLEQQSKQPRVR